MLVNWERCVICWPMKPVNVGDSLRIGLASSQFVIVTAAAMPLRSAGIIGLGYPDMRRFSLRTALAVISARCFAMSLRA